MGAEVQFCLKGADQLHKIKCVPPWYVTNSKICLLQNVKNWWFTEMTCDSMPSAIIVSAAVLLFIKKIG